jgi:hypothetical protein
MFSEIIPSGDVPLSFIETNYLDDRRKVLMDTVDKINRRSGRDTVFYAAPG